MPWYFETMCLHSVPSRMKWHDTVLCCTVGCGVCPHVITILCYCVIVLCCVIVLYSWVWCVCPHVITIFMTVGIKRWQKPVPPANTGHPRSLLPTPMYPLKDSRYPNHTLCMLLIYEYPWRWPTPGYQTLTGHEVFYLVCRVETSTLWHVRRACVDERSRAIFRLFLR